MKWRVFMVTGVVLAAFILSAPTASAQGCNGYCTVENDCLACNFCIWSCCSTCASKCYYCSEWACFCGTNPAAPTGVAVCDATKASVPATQFRSVGVRRRPART